MLAGLDVPYPCVVKPREGVASEDVVLVEDPEDLVLRCKQIQARRADAALVVEEYLTGELCTLETLGDGRTRHVLGGFHTDVSPPPYFVEQGLTFVAAHPEPLVGQVLAQLDALGIGFGACHTEFMVDEGRARIIEVNYRAIGDQCDLLLAQLLDIPLFEYILRTHPGGVAAHGPRCPRRRRGPACLPVRRALRDAHGRPRSFRSTRGRCATDVPAAA